MIRRALLAVMATAFLATCPTTGTAWTHVARVGETLEQLALRYYGRPELSIVIRAANGFVHPDNGRLTRGERVEIPEVVYHRVREGETWAQLADRYLGSAQRGAFLAEMNSVEPDKEPSAGTIAKVPYQLLHILAADESLKTVVRMYFGRSRSTKWLQRYNLTKKKRFGRGTAVLVPLIDVEFTDKERQRVEAERSERFTMEDRQEQIEARAGIMQLKDAFENGRYVELITKAQGLLARGRLTGPQEVGVHQFLAFAYVALGERGLARASFVRALELQPEMDLSPITTSPKILEVFQEAKAALPAGGAPTR